MSYNNPDCLVKQKFSLSDCKTALREILDVFHLPENISRLDEMRAAAGNDMHKSMQTVFPAATQMQMQVVSRYGFLSDGEGLVQFTKAVHNYEDQDPEIRQLNAQVRNILLPPVNVPLPVAPMVAGQHS